MQCLLLCTSQPILLIWQDAVITHFPQGDYFLQPTVDIVTTVVNFRHTADVKLNKYIF